MQRDSTGFPLSVKPSHLFDPAEQMNMAEILAMIVEKACLFVPDVPAGVSKSKAHFRSVKVPKEAFTEIEKFPKEALKKIVSKEELSEVVTVPVVASDLVRSKCLN